MTINRVAKVVKGGRRVFVSALVVAGSGAGEVGFGSGKAGEVPEAINKAGRIAKKSMKKFVLKEGRTIPHEVVGEFWCRSCDFNPSGSRNRCDCGGSCACRFGNCGY